MTLHKMGLLGILCVALCTLCGCETTRFESMPASLSDTCDPNWPGGWIGLDETGHDADFAVFIDKDCTVTNVTSKAPAKSATARVQFFTARGQNHVLLATAQAQRLFEFEADNKLPSSAIPNNGGYFILRWRYEDGYLAFSAPEHQRVAHLIVGGAIDGSVERQPNRSLHNEISGSPEQTQNLLERIDLYAEQPFARLRFTGKSRKSLDQAVNKAKRAISLRDKH